MYTIDDERLPGLLKARGALTALAAAAPAKNSGARLCVREYVRQLYPEIRAARLAGHAFRGISKKLSETPGVPKISPTYLAAVFADVDVEWAKKTGEPIIPRQKCNKRRAAKAA